ncbi:MAG: Xylose isomerase-like barrel [Verrucomicrobiaceae bacterium]|nr:Xylose isomerase-like barrel [Verrucomicrobiaceae bacterium]
MNRRHFLQSTLTAAAASALPQVRAATGRPAVGMDHFAVRGTGWKAPQIIEYAASLKLDAVFLSELGPFESFEDDYLKKLRAQIDAAGLKVYVGGRSVCKTSNVWEDKYGTPDELMALIIKIAKALGSPVARCVLGNSKDRITDGGIERHQEEVIKVFKAAKSRCEAEGLKISIENHSGDQQSEELRNLIEAAGKDYVGANIDPGNAVWALEDPMHNLEVLGPYVNCSSVRDSMIWETPEGAMVQWTAIGEGLVDFAAYSKRFAQLAPGVPLMIETISGFARPFPFLKEEFWKPYSKAPAASFAGWLAMMKKGHAIDPFKAPNKEAEVAYQKGELERSVKWLRDHA